MFKWEFFFLLVVLMSSIAGALAPEGSQALLISKAIFVMAFVLFSVTLLFSGNLTRNGVHDQR